MDMVRVLQMIPRCPDSASAHQIELLSSGMSPDIQVCHWPMDRAGRYQLLRNRFAIRNGASPVIHAWDWSGLMLAWASTRGRILYSLQSLQTVAQIRALRRLSGLTRRIDFACSTFIQKQLLERTGIAPGRCHLIEPGVERIAASPGKRAQLRKRLGLGERDVVALAPGDSTRTARHRLSLWAISILHVYDRRYRLLISGAGPQAPFLNQLARNLKQPAVLVSAAGCLGRAVEQSELLAAADVALITDSLPGSPLPMAMCMAAGPPLIGDANGLAGHYAGHDPRALLIQPSSPKLMARHILELFPVGSPCPDRCGDEHGRAVERFNPDRFRQRIGNLYRSCAADPAD